jgi:hypothetical protein
MLNQELKVSPHGSFKVTQLCQSVAICEAIKGDRYGWGNGTPREPAFLEHRFSNIFLGLGAKHSGDRLSLKPLIFCPNASPLRLLNWCSSP